MFKLKENDYAFYYPSPDCLPKLVKIIKTNFDYCLITYIKVNQENVNNSIDYASTDIAQCFCPVTINELYKINKNFSEFFDDLSLALQIVEKQINE